MGSKAAPIERRERLAPDLFYEEYLSGAGRPVIVTDALHHWEARSKWTFDFFKSRYGSDVVTPTPELSSPFVKVMKLRDYIDYLDSARSPGFWIHKGQAFSRSEPTEPLSTPLHLV